MHVIKFYLDIVNQNLQRKGNVYKINLSDLADQNVVCLLLVSDEKWLWHKRL